ncbi:MAG: HAD-IIA family hydrolase [Acidimicrobiales bacterium]
MTWALDLDGVVWRGDRLLAGADGAIARLRAAGRRVVFLTNNSNAPLAVTVAKLAAFGIPVDGADILTSAHAAASMLPAGSTALVCAGPGVAEALAAAGIETVSDGPADAVVVGWHREFDYARLTVAMNTVLGGARLVATNDDPTYPMADGLVPGGGALVAAVAYASGVAAEVAGKPYPPMVALVGRRVGAVEVMVGDRPDTDGELARRLGARFGLVLTGVTTGADLPVEPAPDMVAADLAALVATELDWVTAPGPD